MIFFPICVKGVPGYDGAPGRPGTPGFPGQKGFSIIGKMHITN